ncbi:hypothetical protein C1646_682759 [Rhizophagus diaphanus]|nr:hypothetical protein C1646_682759 [Rhizophagus diaphanus] [Rhizophagus sp. MUCL 43196]
MASNTRSKVSKKILQKEQYESHPTLSDKDINAETYGVDEDGAPDRINTKRTKLDTTSQQVTSPTQNINDMDVDKNSENEHPLSSETYTSSRDTTNEDPLEPINNDNDKMIIDQQNNETNGDNNTGSSQTQTSQIDKLNTATQPPTIFKETDSRFDSEFKFFFTRGKKNPLMKS